MIVIFVFYVDSKLQLLPLWRKFLDIVLFLRRENWGSGPGKIDSLPWRTSEKLLVRSFKHLSEKLTVYMPRVGIESTSPYILVKSANHYTNFLINVYSFFNILLNNIHLYILEFCYHQPASTKLYVQSSIFSFSRSWTDSPAWSNEHSSADTSCTSTIHVSTTTLYDATSFVW